jgi:hypothetical protein
VLAWAIGFGVGSNSCHYAYDHEGCPTDYAAVATLFGVFTGVALDAALLGREQAIRAAAQHAARLLHAAAKRRRSVARGAVLSAFTRRRSGSSSSHDQSFAPGPAGRCGDAGLRIELQAGRRVAGSCGDQTCGPAQYCIIRAAAARRPSARRCPPADGAIPERTPDVWARNLLRVAMLSGGSLHAAAAVLRESAAR